MWFCNDAGKSILNQSKVCQLTHIWRWPKCDGIELFEKLLCNVNLQKAYLINGLIVKSKTIIKCPNWLDNVIIGLESWSKQPVRFDQDLVQDRSEIEVDIRAGAQLWSWSDRRLIRCQLFPLVWTNYCCTHCPQWIMTLIKIQYQSISRFSLPRRHSWRCLGTSCY